MRNQPVPLVTGFYRDEDRPFSQQDVWNYLPCKTEAQGTRSPLMLKTPPGLFPWLEVAGAPPVRGIHDCEGKLYAVIGTTLYRISLSGVAIPIGTIPGTGRVSMDHNQRANGQQLTVVNGASGYVLDTYTGAFGKITDTGFPGSAVIKFMDGYMLGIDPAGRFAFNSAAAEATDYNTLDRWTSEYRPDRLVGMGRLGGELLLLSANSGEFFGVTSTAQQPYRSKRIFIDKGCAGPHTVVEADNTVFWLGSDGYFYQLDGYNPRRISKRPIEQAIRGMDWWNAFGFVWESEGHTVVYWTFLTGETWGWDCSQQEWHRRESYGLRRWRPSCTARSNGKWYAGDFQKGRIWRIDWGYVWEGEQEFISGFSQPVMHDNQNELIHSRIELVMDVGQVGPTPGAFPVQPEGPSISGAAPDSYVEQPYPGYTYTITAGDNPISSVVILSGSVPAGVDFDDGVLGTEIPTGPGTSTFTIRVTDTAGLYADLTDTIEIIVPRWDPLHTGVGGVLENETKTFVTDITSTQRPLTRSYVGATLADKFYCEVVLDVLPVVAGGDPAFSIGIINQEHGVDEPYVGRDQGSGSATGIGVLPGRQTAQNVTFWGCGDAGDGRVYGPSFTGSGQVLRVAFDGPGGKATISDTDDWEMGRTNGVYGPCETVNANPSLGTNSLSQIFAWQSGTAFYVAVAGRDGDDDTHLRATLRIFEDEFDFDVPAGFVPLGELA